MADKNNKQALINLLSIHFDNIQLDPFEMIDALASVRNSNISFYVIYKSNHPSDYDVLQLFKKIDASPKANVILQNSIVIITSTSNGYEFAIMSYCDYGRSYLNKNIKWRQYSDSVNIEWLNQQLKLKRDYIALLPQNMWKIKKTIFLNSDEINEAEIIYFRTLTEEYRMTTPDDLSEEQRFYRTLNGIPEEEYPKDKLDEIIYQKVVETYPNAKVKSETFLFSTDLANIRSKKEKLSSSFKLYFFAISYNTSNIPIIKENTQLNIDVDLLYYSNIFGKNNIIPINQIIQTDDNLINTINHQKDTYQPISTINI